MEQDVRQAHLSNPQVGLKLQVVLHALQLCILLHVCGIGQWCLHPCMPAWVPCMLRIACKLSCIVLQCLQARQLVS